MAIYTAHYLAVSLVCTLMALMRAALNQNRLFDSGHVPHGILVEKYAAL